MINQQVNSGNEPPVSMQNTQQEENVKLINRLFELKQQGILSDEEFEQKKKEILSKL
jgi:poly(A) polymerase Pap1